MSSRFKLAYKKVKRIIECINVTGFTTYTEANGIYYPTGKVYFDDSNVSYTKYENDNGCYFHKHCSINSFGEVMFCDYMLIGGDRFISGTEPVTTYADAAKI